MTYLANAIVQKLKKTKPALFLSTTISFLLIGQWLSASSSFKTESQSLPKPLRPSSSSVATSSVSKPKLSHPSKAIAASPLPQLPIDAALPLEKFGLFGQVARAAVVPRPIMVTRKKVAGVRFYLTTIDLNNSSVLLNIGLVRNAAQANNPKYTAGVEPFNKFVGRHPSTVVVNGTFFSTDRQKRIMGNMVAGGKVLKYSPAENYGTTLGIRKGRRLEMVTARADGKPAWDQHWFSLTAGPRLLRKGSLWIAPRTEGFTDTHVMGVAQRNAIGYSANQGKLYIATFTTPITLRQEAKIMRAVGCYEAMNLDGGSSTALAHNGKILVRPRRSLTNVIVAYDKNHPAPMALRSSWQQFQGGNLAAYAN